MQLSTNKLNYETKDDVHKSVRDYYGKVLSSTNDLKTSACTASSKPHPLVIKALKSVPNAIKEKYYGCGSAVPLGIEGKTILDLGSGSGQDCYVAAVLAGPKGNVIGIDMTDEQLAVARAHVDEFSKNLGYPQPNLKFLKGYIEMISDAGVKANSVDVVVSNCVVNLSPNKPLVLQEVYKALKEGGEFYFSDIYCDRRLPDSVRSHEVLFGECIAGAMYIEDFIREARKVGFADPRVVETSVVNVEDEELAKVVGNAKFYSITFRLFKIGNLESLCEDYGQVAVYKGTIAGHEHNYILDDHHKFETKRPMLVCGNTASMVGESWLRNHFTIIGDRSVHYGLFDCGDGQKLVGEKSGGSGTGGDNSGGSCC